MSTGNTQPVNVILLMPVGNAVQINLTNPIRLTVGACVPLAAGLIKPRLREDEINCKPFISAGDFNDALKRFKGMLSDGDIECLQAARDELKRHPIQLWMNAEFYIQGNQRAFLFWCGKRKNKFICFRRNYARDEAAPSGSTAANSRVAAGGSSDKIEIYCELGGKNKS